MKKQVLAFLLVMTGLSLLAPSARASHCMGGDITYTCLDTDGNRDSFLVTLKFFRDCKGVSAPTSATLNYSSASCGINGTITLSPVPGQTGIDITPVCPGGQSACSNPSAAYGVEEYVYQGILVLNAQCTDWVLSWSTCCRNAAITTLANPGGESLYLHAMLNNVTVPCNSSPQFLNTPVPFTCVMQFTSYNHGVYDPDGDSLVFTLVNPMDGPSTPVAWGSGYSATNPLSTVNGVSIDPNTGTITFIPDQTQVGVLSVLVEEYRNGVKIGETVRDIQFTVVNCNNNLPTASGIDSSGLYDTAVCPGQSFCFDIYTHDLDPFQSVTIGWNQGIPGGTFTSTGGQYPTATFCWTPTASDVGTHLFTVTVQDDACPYTGTNVYSYHVEVRNPSIDLGPDVSLCDGDSIQMNPLITVDFTSYDWSPVTGVSDPTIKNPVLSPSVTTTYVLHGTNGFCDAYDTITVQVGQTPTLTVTPDTSVCIGESITLQAGSNASNFSWSPSGTLNNPNIANPTATPDSTITYTVTVTNAQGCTNQGTVQVTVNPLPSVNAGLDEVICYGDEIQLTANGTAVSYTWAPSTISPPNQQTVTVSPNSTTTYTVTGTDANGCSNTDQVTVIVMPAPSVSADYDTTIFAGDPANLFGTGSSGIISWIWNPGNISGQNIVVTPEETTWYVLTVTDTNGCTNQDSVLVTVLVDGEVYIPNAFTPNGDSRNDELYVINEGPVNLNYFRVYNRWGQLVFEGTNVGPGFGWDGTYKGEPQPSGVYTWVVSITSFVDGTVKTKSGNVTLIR